MAGETTTTSLNDLIHSEAIEQLILQEHRPASVHQLCAWIRDASMAQSGSYKFPRWDKVDMTAGTKTEGTGTFTVTEQTTSTATATAGVVGIGVELTDEAAQDAMKSLADMIILNLRRGEERVTTDLCALFTSATNTTAVGNNPFNLTQWGIATAAFKAQNPVGARVAYIGSNASLRGLRADMRTTGASILANPLYRGQEILAQPGQGFLGFFEGYEVYESSACPDNDADTISTALAVVGDGGALGLALWWPWRHQVMPNPAAAGNELYTSARYGVCITDNGNLREIQSED